MTRHFKYLGVSMALVLGGAGGCGFMRSIIPGGTASYRLPLPASQAHAAFAPLQTCAGQQGLTAVEHPDSVNVKVNGTTWVQYMIQGDQFNMVVVVSKDVPSAARDQEIQQAKGTGDQIYACAAPQVVTTRDVEAGPIWNNDDAKGKCPSVCAPGTWDGNWHTTVPSVMSVCSCALPAGAAPPAPAQQ